MDYNEKRYASGALSHRESSPQLLLYFFGLRRLNSEKCCESIFKLFLDSLKMKIFPSDLVFVTLVKMVLKRSLFGTILTLFRTD
jgi:hypothetical protein